MSEVKSKMPWVEKYRPTSLKEMALPTAKVSGHKVDLAEDLTNFIKNFFFQMKKINDENKKIRAHNRIAPEKEQKEERKQEFDTIDQKPSKAIKDIHYVDTIYGEKKNFNNVYNKYVSNHEVLTEIDDFGLMHEMMTVSELSKAFRGRERKNMNTTINVTRDINEKEELEEDFNSQETGGFGQNLKSKIKNIK